MAIDVAYRTVMTGQLGVFCDAVCGGAEEPVADKVAAMAKDDQVVSALFDA